MTATASTLATALAFCRHGLPVVALWWPIERAGRLICACAKGPDCGRTAAKHPFGKTAPRGILSASADPALAKGWFGYQARDANLGVTTDGLIVIDADPRHGGDETLRELERTHEFPPTWRVLTGGGGEHVYFKCPAGVVVRSSQADTNPVLGPGIDIRARNGYVVAPPSRHISGRHYAWSVDHHPADVELAEPPAWLIRLLAAGARAAGNGAEHPPASSEIWRKLTHGKILEYRDAAAAQVAGHLLRRYVDPYLVLGLLDAWNAAYCEPPLSASEVRAIVNRVARLEERRRDADQGGEHARAG